MINQALRNEFNRAVNRRIARDSSGRFYLLINRPDRRGGSVFSLRISRDTHPATLDDFRPPMRLDWPASTKSRAGWLSSAALAIDPQDRLHLIGNTEEGRICYAIADLRRSVDAGGAPGKLPLRNPATLKSGWFTLARKDARLGDLTVAPDGKAWVTWTEASPDHASSIHLGRFSGKRWSATRVADGYGFFPGTLLLDDEGNFHLAWHDIRQESRYLGGKVAELGKRKKWRIWMYMDWAHRAALTKVGGRVLAAFEDYGSAIRYLYPDEGKQHRPDDVNFGALPVAGSDPRIRWETSHSQQFAVDRYGVRWLFFINSSREHLFYSRWLGTAWGPLCNSLPLRQNSPRMESNHLPMDRLSVEEKSPAGAGDIGLVVSNESARPHTLFHRMAVPSLVARPGKKVLFLDLKEVQRMEGLELVLNPARKYEGNPIVRAGAPNDFDAHGAGHFAHVVKENGLYRMWYTGWRVDPSQYWAKWLHIGYAEGPDGYHFKKVPLGLAPYGKNRNTNIVPGLEGSCSVYVDAADPDPRRRYKALAFPAAILQHEEARQGRMDPWKDQLTGTLLTSPDGIHWTGEPITVDCPGGRPAEIIPQSFFRDVLDPDPNKRFKAYGFSSLNLGRRGGSYMHSPDCVHWTASPQNPVLDAFARCIPPVRGGKVHQIHDMVVWQEGDYYLSLYQYQHDGNRLDLELAASRDGENFVCVKPEEKVIPAGKPGSWDTYFLRPNAPLVDGGKILLYYGGLSRLRSTVPGALAEANERRLGGVATLRLDGFTHLQTAEGRSLGSFTTIPIDPPRSAQSLVVNCQCRADAWLAVEVIDAATGRPVPGYSLRECRRITGDSLAREVRWKNRADLGGLPQGRFQLKFHFQSVPGLLKLFAFGFK